MSPEPKPAPAPMSKESFSLLKSHLADYREALRNAEADLSVNENLVLETQARVAKLKDCIRQLESDLPK